LDASHLIHNKVLSNAEFFDMAFGHVEKICIELVILRMSRHIIRTLLLHKVYLVFEQTTEQAF